jgi:glutathione peroxidase
MKNINPFAIIFTALFLFTSIAANAQKTVYDFIVNDISGKKVSLSDYKGKTLLIVNVASKCGLTPQYEDLQALYEKHSSKGLVVLGFPANNFMAQEPGSNAEINTFCKEQYKVSFPMFSKISVQGENIHPLYRYLTTKKENGHSEIHVKWNFQKFLIGPDGKLVDVILPRERVKDADVEKRILKFLK